jgi:hypothetical protein
MSTERRRLLIAIALIMTLGCAFFLTCLAFGICAAVGFFVTVWGPKAILGPPPGLLSFFCFIAIALIGSIMAAISSYVLLILPLAIRWNNCSLAGCDDRRVAYYADGLAKLMEIWRSDPVKQQIPEK